MNAFINVVLPVFGIILTGYLAGHLEVLGWDSAVALWNVARSPSARH
jgi:predicted permease